MSLDSFKSASYSSRPVKTTLAHSRDQFSADYVSINGFIIIENNRIVLRAGVLKSFVSTYFNP